MGLSQGQGQQLLLGGLGGLRGIVTETLGRKEPEPRAGSPPLGEQVGRVRQICEAGLNALGELDPALEPELLDELVKQGRLQAVPADRAPELLLEQVFLLEQLEQVEQQAQPRVAAVGLQILLV